MSLTVMRVLKPFCYPASNLSKTLRHRILFIRKFSSILNESITEVPRRALLYVPGDNMKMIKKAQKLGADCVCLDLEDGVSATSKLKARKTVVGVLNAKTDFSPSTVAVRINSLSSGLANEDLVAVLNCEVPPTSICVPKLDTLDEVRGLIGLLHPYPTAKGLQLITQVESAQGLMNLQSICTLLTKELSRISARLVAIIFGSDDFCASVGAMRSTGGWELLYARQKVVTIAKAFRAQAIDMVHIDYKAVDSLRVFSLDGAAMGFTGKQVIHPSQIPIVHECFSPSEDKVKWATELISAFENYKQHGKGAFSFRNQMIDKPSLLQAENIKNLADIIKQRES